MTLVPAVAGAEPLRKKVPLKEVPLMGAKRT